VSSPKFELGTSRYDSKELLLKPGVQGVQKFSRNLRSLQKSQAPEGWRRTVPYWGATTVSRQIARATLAPGLCASLLQAFLFFR